MHRTMSEHVHNNHSMLDVTGSEGAGRGSGGEGEAVIPAPTSTPRAATDLSQSIFTTYADSGGPSKAVGMKFVCKDRSEGLFRCRYRHCKVTYAAKDWKEVTAKVSNVTRHVKNLHANGTSAIAKDLQDAGVCPSAGRSSVSVAEEVDLYWQDKGYKHDISVHGLPKPNTILQAIAKSNKRVTVVAGSGQAAFPDAELARTFLMDALVELVTASPVSFSAATKPSFLNKYVCWPRSSLYPST